LSTSKVTPPHAEAIDSKPQYSMWQLVTYALRLGTFGFGGPIALVGYMHRDLVEQRKWISEEDYREGLALSQLAPGPLAAQLAIYLGFVHYRILGATLVGLAFVLPSFFMVIAIGAAYVAYGGLTWMQAVFYGVGAAVIGIIAISAYKLTTKTVGKDNLLWAFYLVAAAVTIVTESEIVWIFLIAGIVAWLVKAQPKRGFQSGRCWHWRLSFRLSPAWPRSSTGRSCCRSHCSSAKPELSCSAAASRSCPSCTGAW
jgi:chromate transporter